jgi:cytochrome c556
MRRLIDTLAAGAQTVRTALAANDFDAAAEAARGVAESCRACHDVYRP